MEFGFGIMVPIVEDLYQFLKCFLLHLLEILTFTLGKSSRAAGEPNRRLKDDGVRRIKCVRDMPGPVAVPFFGTMLSKGAGNVDLRGTNEDFVKRYGTVVKVEHFWNYPIVLVLEADDIERLLKDACIYRPELEIVTTYRRARPDRYKSVGIVNSQGEDWKRLRLTLADLHNHKYILKNMESCDEIMTDAVSLIRGLQKDRIPNFDEIVLRITTEHSCKLILNKRMGFLDRNTSPKMQVFINGTHGYFKALQVSMYGFPAWKYFPTKTWRQYVKFENDIYDTFSEVVDEEVKNNSAGGLLKTILESDLSEGDKRTLAMDLVLGAMEPNLNSTIYALYWISRSPEVDQRLFEELRSVMPEKDSGFSPSSLARVPYLKACVQESFRLTPTTPNLARFLETETQIQDYRVPAYTLFILQCWHACLQDKNFYRAKDFVPERWLSRQEGGEGPRFRPHRPRVLNTFGYGRRECPGRRFATQEIIILVAKLLRNFKLTFPEEIGLNYLFLQSPNLPVSVSVAERTE